MKNKIIVFIFSFLFLSCNKNRNTIEIKIDNNEFEHQYFSNKEYDSSHKYTNNKLTSIVYSKGDSVYLKKYDNLGKIESEGFLYDDIKVGLWKFYKDGNIDKVFEYINLCGEQYLNQGWYYDGKGKLLYENTNYYEVQDYKPTLSVGEKTDVKIYYKRLLRTQNEKQENILGFCLVKDTISNYCYSLKNENIKCLYDITKDTIEFEFSSKNVGKFYVTGFIRENYEDKETGTTGNRDVFISIPFEVIK
jgi:hypothetical protein